MKARDGERITKKLRDSILRLELRPGQVMDEAEISERMGVSRTPIREAIIQLISDGLVVRDGRKAKVAPLDFDDVPNLYDALLVSSRMIHRLAATNRTDADLAQIEDALKQFEKTTSASSGVERSDANVAFHKAISRAAHNRHFSQFYESALIGTIRIQRACFARKDNYRAPVEAEELMAHVAETKRQHRVIFEAIKSGDIEGSDASAVEHFQLTKDRIIRVLFDKSLAFSGALNLDDLHGSFF